MLLEQETILRFAFCIVFFAFLFALFPSLSISLFLFPLLCFNLFFFLFSTDECVLLTAGMQADTMMLHRKLLSELQEFSYVHKKQMSPESIAQRLSNILYSRRFFPYYTFNLLLGFDHNGIVFLLFIFLFLFFFSFFFSYLFIINQSTNQSFLSFFLLLPSIQIFICYYFLFFRSWKVLEL